MTRRPLILFGSISATWCVLAWLAFSWLVQERTGELVARAASDARQDVSGISENFERILNRLQGVPAVLAAGSDAAGALAHFGPAVARSSLSPKDAMAAWTKRPDLLALDRQLLTIAGEMDVDIIWVMNAAGDCIAASNFGDATSFIGTSYADRSYFRSAQSGKRGHQYAMGRVTNVPGLFFSAPVTVAGRFLGAVAIKIDLPRLAPWIQHPHAFVTDEYGVIILAADHSLEMRALPGAPVQRLPVEQRRARYKREAFDTLGVTTGGPNAPVFVAGSPLPHVAARSDRPQYGISVHVLAPVNDIDTLRRDASAVSILLAVSGILLTALVFGIKSYTSRVRQHRESMEATNASLSKLNEHLIRLASTDPLTDVANRRHFQTRLDEELARSGRYGHACSLLLIDLDLFKDINDRHGHSGGDEALRHFARIARGQLRDQDELGRLGGEEFAVLLPETTLDSAVTVAERIRHAVETGPAVYADARIAMTASFGVAVWKPSAESADALLKRADKALYAAKSAGRNCVVKSGANSDTDDRQNLEA